MANYLIDGSGVECAQGTSESSTKVIKSTVYINNQKIVVKSETTVNSVFGKCLLKPLPNGDYLPCTYITGGTWIKVKQDVIHGSEFVLETSKLICNQMGGVISVTSNSNKTVME